MNIAEKLRSGHVRRWHIVAVAREQTIADHMYRVGVIAEEILRILGLFDWNNNLTLNTMRWAAIHDRHEYLLGDLPTPGKTAIRNEWGNPGPYADIMDRVAGAVDPEAEELRVCVEEGGDCELAGRIVKFADLLEAMNYVGIFGVGSHARQVWVGLYGDCHKAMVQVAGGLGGPLPNDEQAAALVGLIDKLREGYQWR